MSPRAKKSPLPQCTRSVRDAVAVKHWPRGLGAATELLSFGWPYLRRLTGDEAKTAKTTALKVLDATEPVRVVDWPRAAAVAYLHGFAAMNRTRRGDPSVKAALSNRDPPAVALADTLLTASVGVVRHHAFHWRDAFFLLECFLGPSVMAERTLAALEGVSAADWTDDNPDTRTLELVFALECFLLRADDAALTADAAVRLKRLRSAKRGRTLLGRRIAITLEGTPAVRAHRDHFLYDLPFLTVDTAYFEEYVTEYPTWRLGPQHVYLAGPRVLSIADLSSVRRDAAWKQRELVVVFGLIEDPAVAAMMRIMVRSKAAGRLARRWLVEHGDG